MAVAGKSDWYVRWGRRKLQIGVRDEETGFQIAFVFRKARRGYKVC